MAYFGCIDEKNFNELSTKDQKHLLLKKGVFEELTIVPLAINGIPFNNEKDNSRLEIRISKHLVNECYAFVLKALNPDIDNTSSDFYFDFKEKIYGLDSKEKKMLALKAFKDIVKDYLSNEIQFFQHEKSSRGIKHVNPQSILSRLFDQQTLLKDKLASTDLINQYIFGNKEAFNASNIYDQELIHFVVKFESNIKILVSLNDKFKFEEDLYFSNFGVLWEKYNTKYKSVFSTFRGYQFVHEKIVSFRENKQAKIESLFVALENEKVITSNDIDFIKFIYDEYNITLSKIRKHVSRPNYAHKERIQLFTADWRRFSS